jgi:hypothetical protein
LVVSASVTGADVPADVVAVPEAVVADPPAVVAAPLVPAVVEAVVPAAAVPAPVVTVDPAAVVALVVVELELLQAAATRPRLSRTGTARRRRVRWWFIFPLGMDACNGRANAPTVAYICT